MQLTQEEIFNIVVKNEKLNIGYDELEKTSETHSFIKDHSKGKTIYGVNTGFGPMAQYVIDKTKQKQLQLNLIRSHCSGSGEMIDPMFIRATLLARLNSLKQGYSGVSNQTILILRDFINYEIYPVIYQHGGVGASGDLVQLSHIALSMIGEGEVYHKGQILPTRQVMDKFGITPLEITLREGLALINGTSTMTGVGQVNLFYAKNLVNWSVKLSSLMYEVFSVFDDFFSEELNAVKKHAGQREIAAQLRNQLKDSGLIRQRLEENYVFQDETNIMENKMQEYYSIRCTPQILGPIHDTLVYAEQVLNNEMNSVNDNPIIHKEAKNVFHGGNFHGDYVSLEMDKIKLAIIKLSILSERQLNYMFNEKINKTLPPFMNQGILGLNLGLQGTQFPATSTVSENMTLGSSHYINNISTNGDNQDVVSMGTNAALITNRVIKNTYEVLAIQYMAVMNAVNYLNIEDRLSPANRALFQDAKNVMAFATGEDTIHYKTLKRIKEHLFQLEDKKVPEEVAVF